MAAFLGEQPGQLRVARIPTREGYAVNNMVGWFAILALALVVVVIWLAVRGWRVRSRPGDTDEALHGEGQWVDPDASAHAGTAWKRPF